MATKVIMPQLGESVVEGTVTKWLRKEGEDIQEFDALLEVNTDKVDTEIPSPASGTVLRLLVPEGTTVQAGAVLAWIGDPGETLPASALTGGEHKTAAPQAAVQPTETAAAPTQELPAGTKPGRDLGFISPVVARLARDNNLDLSLVKGSGGGGRITKQDVLAYLEQKKAPAQKEEPAAWETPGEGDLFRPTELMFPAERPRSTAEGAAERPRSAAEGAAERPRSAAEGAAERPHSAAEGAAERPRSAAEGAEPGSAQPTGKPASGSVISLSPMRRQIAEHMALSSRTSPHVTTVMETDLGAVTAHRQAQKQAFEADGANLTFSAYFVAAAVQALKTFPLVNSSWGEDGIHLHRQINIGLAASLGSEGLIVPVIKSADGLSLLGIARAVNDLAERARARRLQPDEVRGGTFTITNHGTGGSLFATPIINQPQCAILGVGLIQKRAVVINEAIAIRPMAYLSLSFDHRILDGSSADAFLAKVVETLEKWV